MQLLPLLILSTVLVLGHCGCGHGYYKTDEGDCERCGRGNYCPANSTEPTPCPVGTYCPHYVAWSEEHCYLCNPGTYSNQTGTESCFQCGQGNYCPVGSLNPTPCPAGKFSRRVRAYMLLHCTPCKPGTYGDIPGASSCLSCPANHYCNWGTITPTPCPEGETSPPNSNTCRTIRPVPGNCTAGQFKNDLGACERCLTGHYCPEGSTEPTPCPNGTWGPSLMARSVDRCRLCRQGSYNDETGAVRCKDCGQGYYCDFEGLVSATPCPKGTFTNFIRAKGVSYCRKCSVGYYGDEEGLARCKPCPEGSYCEAGTEEPTSCPDGHTSPPYSRSEDQCRPEA